MLSEGEDMGRPWVRREWRRRNKVDNVVTGEDRQSRMISMVTYIISISNPATKCELFLKRRQKRKRGPRQWTNTKTRLHWLWYPRYMGSERYMWSKCHSGKHIGKRTWKGTCNGLRTLLKRLARLAVRFHPFRAIQRSAIIIVIVTEIYPLTPNTSLDHIQPRKMILPYTQFPWLTPRHPVYVLHMIVVVRTT